jgi:hypothetical protein
VLLPAEITKDFCSSPVFFVGIWTWMRVEIARLRRAAFALNQLPIVLEFLCMTKENKNMSTVTYFTDPAAIINAAHKAYALQSEYIFANVDSDADNRVLIVQGEEVVVPESMEVPVVLRVYRGAADAADVEAAAEDADADADAGTALSEREPGTFQIHMLTPAQVYRVTKNICSAGMDWVYFHGLNIKDWAGLFSITMCSFCHCSGPGPDSTLCTVCHSIACSLCAEEMGTGTPTPNSHRFAARAEKLAACRAHGAEAHVQCSTLGLLPSCRVCDLCKKSLQWGMQWLASTHSSGDTHDVCRECQATEEGAKFVADHGPMATVSSSIQGINEFSGLGVLSDWVVVAQVVDTLYVPTPNSTDDNDLNMQYDFEEVLVCVRKEASPSGFRTAVIIADENWDTGMIALGLDLPELLEVVRSGNLIKVLLEAGFDVHYDN